MTDVRHLRGDDPLRIGVERWHETWMSNGMDVENWHYAPFVAALKKITGSNEWTV